MGTPIIPRKQRHLAKTTNKQKSIGLTDGFFLLYAIEFCFYSIAHSHLRIKLG